MVRPSHPSSVMSTGHGSQFYLESRHDVSASNLGQGSWMLASAASKPPYGVAYYWHVCLPVLNAAYGTCADTTEWTPEYFDEHIGHHHHRCACTYRRLKPLPYSYLSRPPLYPSPIARNMKWRASVVMVPNPSALLAAAPSPRSNKPRSNKHNQRAREGKGQTVKKRDEMRRQVKQ
ncbi:hypothetical protein BKA80DRAFT_2755 [Phyllosticta citrichinensis]